MVLENSLTRLENFLQSTRVAATFVANYESCFPIILMGQPIRAPHYVHACSGAPELIVSRDMLCLASLTKFSRTKMKILEYKMSNAKI